MINTLHSNFDCIDVLDDFWVWREVSFLVYDLGVHFEISAFHITMIISILYSLISPSFPEIMSFLGDGSLPSQSMVDIYHGVASLEGVGLGPRCDG